MADENPSQAVPDAGLNDPSPLKDRGPAPPARRRSKRRRNVVILIGRPGRAGWRHFFVALLGQL